MSLKVRIGVQPINWSNSDFRDLGGDIPLETCLTEMKEAGYEGTSLGYKFPKSPDQLKPILEKFELQLVSGWHSTYLLEGDFETEKDNLSAHLGFLKAMGSQVVVLAECSRQNFLDRNSPLTDRPIITKEQEWRKFTTEMEQLGQICHQYGLKPVYHQHMGTVIQSVSDLDRLLTEAPSLGLVLDSGHLVCAREDLIQVCESYADRIWHVHLKDVRNPIVEKIYSEKLSLYQAISEGVFTVPGDGSIDFKEIVSFLNDVNYHGWLVVEAEQNPEIANPRQYASQARQYLRAEFGL